jgi:RES domain-containing protein
MQVWRIASASLQHKADDLRGHGAELTGGRWNSKGLPAVYCASNVSLACLETLVHLNASTLPLNRYVVEITIPDSVWEKRTLTTLKKLPATWGAIPAGMESVAWGDAWLKANTSAVLQVPSAIVTQDSVVLINPRHRDATRIKAAVRERFVYDGRLLLS